MNERIDSILFQTYPVKEIIILDDCSSDDSVKFIKQKIKYNKSGINIRLIENEKILEVFFTVAKSFSSSKTEYIWIAEADDSSDARFWKQL